MSVHHCGAENADDAKFCSGCGERLGAAGRTKSCPECGNETAADARFCSSCGARFDAPPRTSGRARSSPWRYAIAGLAVVIGLAGIWTWWFVSAGSHTPASTAANAARPIERETAQADADRPASGKTETRSERIAQVQAVHGKKQLGSRSPREACAGRDNFLSRSICETAKCSEAAYAKHPICLDLFARQHENERLQREGYAQ